MTKNTRTHKCQYSTWYIYYINMMILVNNEWMPYNFFYTYDMIVNFCAIHKIILVVTRMMRKQVIHTTFVLEITAYYYLCLLFFFFFFTLFLHNIFINNVNLIWLHTLGRDLRKNNDTEWNYFFYCSFLGELN